MKRILSRTARPTWPLWFPERPLVRTHGFPPVFEVETQNDVYLKLWISQQGFWRYRSPEAQMVIFNRGVGADQGWRNPSLAAGSVDRHAARLLLMEDALQTDDAVAEPVPDKLRVPILHAAQDPDRSDATL